MIPPRPWKYTDTWPGILDAEGCLVVRASAVKKMGTTCRHIANCVNMHERLAEALDTRREACRQGWRTPRPRPIKIVLSPDAGEAALAIVHEEQVRFGGKKKWKAAASVRLRKLGLPYEKIGAMLELHHSTVMHHVRKGKV